MVNHELLIHDLDSAAAGLKPDVGFGRTAQTEPLWKRLAFIDQLHVTITQDMLEEWFIDHGLPVKVLKIHPPTPYDACGYAIMEFHGSTVPVQAFEMLNGREVVPGLGKVILAHYHD